MGRLDMTNSQRGLMGELYWATKEETELSEKEG